ncbi:MAG TPA: ATP-binding protein [Solirubrobacteraceae bacterium]|nr:ATP-binding protein [Solirubrobacteraceae bacterium]
MNERLECATTLDACYGARPCAIAQARAEVAALAAQHGAGEDELERVRLAVSEAVTNALMHAYGGDQSRAVQVTAAVIDGELTVVVADDGCGLGAAKPSPGLGLGLGVISLGCDALTVLARAGGGTQLEMRFALRDGSRGAQARGSLACASSPA